MLLGRARQSTMINRQCVKCTIIRNYAIRRSFSRRLSAAPANAYEDKPWKISGDNEPRPAHRSANSVPSVPQLEARTSFAQLLVLRIPLLINYLSLKRVPQVGGRLSWSDNWLISIRHCLFQESQNGALLRLDLVLILQVVRSI